MYSILEAAKKTITVIVLSCFFVMTIQAIPNARAVDATFNVTLTVDSEVAINGTATGTVALGNIALLPNISISNTVASNSQNDIEIETTDPDGYTLTLRATSTPAMQNDGAGGDIANHSNGDTPAEWVVSSATEFGFSVFSSSGTSGADVEDSFDDPLNDATDATSCLGLAANTAPNRTAFASPNEIDFAAASTTAATIAQRASATTGPTDIDLCFYVEANSDNPDAGTYTATIVLQATANP